MISTPSSRKKLSASNTALLQASTRSPGRSRTTYEPRLSLKRVIGTTCTTPTAFDTAGRCFAYVAGGAVVVVALDGSDYTQRFYRARPTATPVFQVGPSSKSSPSPKITTPKANDTRNRVARGPREPLFSSPDWNDSQASKTWTSRERIKAATCVSLSSDGRFLAVGETGYAPRVLIFSVTDCSSDTPLVSISEHGFGVACVAWSRDGKFLASLGTTNDAFIFIWKIDPRNGSAKLFQQSRCTSAVAGMIWIGNSLITFGTRHMRAWKVVDDAQQPPSPTKRKVGTDAGFSTPQKTLAGRNVILGCLLDTTFTCGVALDESNALLCSEGGDVCLLDNTNGQLKLTQVTVMDYGITCCTRYGSEALIGGKNSQFARLAVDGIMDCAANVVVSDEPGLFVLTAMGFVQDQLVTLDSNRAINVWKTETLPEESNEKSASITIPGQSDAVLGVQALTNTEESGLAFFTWSASGKVLIWDLNGCVQDSFDIVLDEAPVANGTESSNQLCAMSTDGGKIFAAGDKLGILRVLDYATREILMETKAHASEITSIAVHQNASRAYIATSGRDRTVQLFQRISTGSFELLQTLEFPARVTHLILSADGKIITSSMDRTIQVHELMSKDDDPDTLAAIQCRSIVLKTSPTSMALDLNCKSLFVSNLGDRSVLQFDIESGQAVSAFKCTDENGSENAVLDSLVFGPAQQDEPSFILGLSNTDKSVRVYNATTGAFMDREWGHTESINGVVLVDGGQGNKKVVSVGCDGTIFVWDLDLRDPQSDATIRSPSPARDVSLGSTRPPRRVFSKAEISEFPRPTSSHSGRRSPPRTLRPRKSRNNLSTSSAASAKTPTGTTFDSPSIVAEKTPSRKTSYNISSSPTTTDTSPPSARLNRRPSMPTLGATSTVQARKKTSAVNLRGAYGGSGSGSGSGSLQAASEQTCRQLRAYRSKLTTTAAAEAITPETLAELDAELRLTGAAVAERVSRTLLAVSEPALSGLLDRYSEQLVDMLDEKLKLRFGEGGGGHGGAGGGGLLGVEDGLALLRLAAEGRDGEDRPRTAHGAAPSLRG